MKATILAATIAFLGAGCAKRPVVTHEVGGCIGNDKSAFFPISGPSNGAVTSAFDGFGCNSLAKRDGVMCLHLRPKVSLGSFETHAGLVLGPEADGDLSLSCGVFTAAQTRTAAAPHEHEVGWLIWHYEDNDHFYYLAAKPNGWELGKRDPAFPGGQRFLATGADQTFPVGKRHELRIAQTGDRIDASIDGMRLAPFVDRDHPYRTGKIGFYCEDSEVFFDSVSLQKP